MIVSEVMAGCGGGNHRNAAMIRLSRESARSSRALRGCRDLLHQVGLGHWISLSGGRCIELLGSLRMCVVNSVRDTSRFDYWDLALRQAAV